MSVDSADVAWLLHLEKTTPAPDDDELAPLTTTPALLAFVATQARTEGDCDEADAVELIVRCAGFTPRDVRASERVLRRLGYRAVADRLREIAGRRKTSLRPL